jgi:hypothetical protein
VGAAKLNVSGSAGKTVKVTVSDPGYRTVNLTTKL